MKREPYQTTKGITQYRPVLTPKQAERAVSNGSKGFCLACGKSSTSHVEPDARRYTCESCKAPKVYGIEELMIMGLIRITD